MLRGNEAGNPAGDHHGEYRAIAGRAHDSEYLPQITAMITMQRVAKLRTAARFFTRFLALSVVLVAPALSQPVDIGSRLELFIDRYLIDEVQGAELRLHHPVKAPAAKSPLPPRFYGTIIKDGDIYRAYWRGRDPGYKGPSYSGHLGEIVQYAESRDGIDWNFPNVGMYEVDGSRVNNVILAKQSRVLHNFSPFLDTRPGVPREERYKALAGYGGIGGNKPKEWAKSGRGLHAFVSADGIHWTRKSEVVPYRPEWRHAFDSQNVSFWSPEENQYVCYFRTWISSENLRSISRTTSVDFETWTDPVAMDPNLPGEHFYTSQTHPYFRAPHIYIALPTRFVPGRGDAPAYNMTDVNATDIMLMTSRAGSTGYDRLFTEAFIRPGLDSGRWRNRSNYVSQNVVPTGPTEMSMYHRLGDRYTLRTDGFVSVNAGAKGGELSTKPLTFSGSKLLLNFSTSAVGGIRIEIQTADGVPVPGFTLDDAIELYGDSIKQAYTWRSGTDVSELAGKPVRLRFVLSDADLYSFRFR